jgi:hypothetical protein
MKKPNGSGKEEGKHGAFLPSEKLLKELDAVYLRSLYDCAAGKVKKIQTPKELEAHLASL